MSRAVHWLSDNADLLVFAFALACIVVAPWLV